MGRNVETRMNNMKKTLYFIAAAMFLAAGCQKNEYVPDSTQGQKTLTVGVADETDTRVGFDSSNAFYWQEGDQIGVLTTEGFMQMTLDSQYANQTTGVFTGNFQGAIGNYVVYPYGNHSVADGQLTYNLPASYTYTSIDAGANSMNPPMFGTITDGRGLLKHLGSFFQITVTNIPSGGDDMKLTFTADKRISGNFTADLSAETPVINTDDSEGNTVTISFSNTISGSAGTFYIPVPLGTYESITVEIMDGQTLLATNTWSDQVVERKTPKKGSIEVQFIAKINNDLYSSIQEAIDAAVNHTVILVHNDKTA